MDFFRICLAFCLILQALSVPLPQSSADFCTGSTLNYQAGQTYTYTYETETALFINDISDEARSTLNLAASVDVTARADCTFDLQLSQTTLTGESVASAALEQLSIPAQFRLNAQGDLDDSMSFSPSDQAWSKNIKRAIASAFQVKAYSELRSAENTESKSAVFYENDVLGRCRTTYSVAPGGFQSANSYTLAKTKSLQRCTLVTGQKGKSSGGQYVPYKQIPEFFDGRLFIEDYNCQSVVSDSLVSSVACREVSTFKLGSRGVYGAQAIVSTKLQFVKAAEASSSSAGDLVSEKLNFEYYSSKQNNIETAGFSAEQFVEDVCSKVLESGLANDHSVQFKDLALTMKGWTASQMVAFYKSSADKCTLGGLTAAQAIVFVNTDESVEASLDLVETDSFASQKYITEYPILTALARNPAPSANLIEKIKSFIAGKPADFDYLNKLSLVYSTLVHTYCKNEGCDESQLAAYASVFSSALGSDCSDPAKAHLVVPALKSVGNIGFFPEPAVLARCARSKANSVEVRVTALQASRRFSCHNLEKTTVFYDLLQDTTDDSEVRITAFLSLMRCSDLSEQFAQFASTKLAALLLSEPDQQVISFIIDYGKERGLTSILNAVLDDPTIRHKFHANFKEVSWNNYKYKYNVLRDGALELDTSVIFTPQTWLPRSISFNVTMHAFGASVNGLEANLRLEGLDEALKAALVDKLTSEKFMKRVLAEPEKLIDILQVVAAKLNYKQEAAKLTLSLRVYGNDVFYSSIDNKENFLRLAKFIKSPRETLLYRQVETIKNVFFIDTTIRQPLVNGLTFSRHLGISASALLSKKSSKESEDGLKFDVDNLWSVSGSFTGTFEVNVNPEQKLALKKKSLGSARLKAKVSGFKKDGHWQYNMELSPMAQIPLVRVDGQFYKLGRDSVYTKVTEFKTTQKKYTLCNTDQFQTTFGGLSLCLSVDRPSLGSLRKILSDRRQGDLQEQFAEYYADLNAELADSDSVDDTARPMLPLAGPYHYELTLNNPDLVKTLQLDVHFSRSQSSSEVSATVATDSTKRVQFLYSRLRKATFAGLHGKLDLSLTQLDTNDVRFRVQAEAEYQKLKVLTGHLEVSNKIVRPFHHKLSFGRDARGTETDDHLVPQYHLDLLMDSSRGPRRYNLHFDVKPSGQDVTSSFVLERASPSTNQQTVRYVTGDLSLTRNPGSADLEYALQAHAHNLFLQSQLDLSGTVLLSMFKSNIDLSIDYKSAYLQLPSPAQIRLGHDINLSEGGRSTLSAAVKHAYRHIDHSVLVTFSGDVAERQLDFVSIDLSRPGLKQPVQLFFEKTETAEGSTLTKNVQFGARNMERDLSQSAGSFAQTLVKVDFEPTLRSLTVQFVRSHTRGAKISHELSVKKNDKAFVVVRDEVYGELAKVRENFSELAKTAFGASLYIKALENSGAISANLDLEASKAQQSHKAELSFKTDNLFKIISRVASFNAKFVSTKEQFSAQFELKRLGEVKSFKVFSTSGLRRKGDSAEFSVGYEKRLANGKVFTAAGTASFTFANFKNFQTSVDVPGFYNHQLTVANSRDQAQTGLFAQHNFDFVNSHLDYETVQNRFHLAIHNATLSPGLSRMDFSVDARKGPVGQLDSAAGLDTLASATSNNAFSSGLLVSTDNSLGLKSTRFNLDLAQSLSYALSAEGLALATKTDLKLPAIITDPGKLNYVKHEARLSSSADRLSVFNRFSTDSKLFGRVFKSLNGDYKREHSEEQGLKVEYSAEYELASERKLVTPLSGSELDLTACSLSGAFSRQKTDRALAVEHAFQQTCAGRLLLANSVSLKRAYDGEQRPSTRLSLGASSSLLPYPPVSVQAAHDQFHARHGLLGLHVSLAGQGVFSNEFSYDRELAADHRLHSARYSTATSFGEQMRKSCSLHILHGADYYNAFDCRLNTTKVPNMELSYGYKLRLANVAERAYGRRAGELSVVVPGRTLRAEYSANYPAYFEGSDDDEDANNEREFNATSTVFWNYAKEPSQFIRVEAKRDNVAKGKSTTFVQFVNTPHFDLLRFSVDKTRTFNETRLVACAQYELKSGPSNSLTLDATLSSDLATSRFALETDLARPSFNTRYENRFNKLTGRLQYLSVRVAKLLQLTVDNEFDPEQRRVALHLASPDASLYTLAAASSDAHGLHTVQATLSRQGRALSTLTSRFDARQTRFDATVHGLATSRSYSLSFGVFNESLATAELTDLTGQHTLGRTSLALVRDAHTGSHELVLSSRFDRFWRQLQADILGGEDSHLAKQSPDFNSYFGDVYAAVTEELKPVVAAHRAQRAAIVSDLRNLAGILADFYSNFLGPQRRREFQRNQMAQMAAALELELKSDKTELPIYKKVLRAYNSVAARLTELSLRIRQHSVSLSTLVPRLPTYAYNEEADRQFANNLVVRRPALHARNLYQFNHEYRDYVRQAGARFLQLKANLVRSNLGGLSLSSLLNKYKPRQLTDFTLVAHVFNRRNVIGFDGESVTLQSRCKYLLAHDVHKNRFSVVLNYDKNTEYPLTVHAYGHSIDIGYAAAAVADQAVALPRHVALGGDNGQMSVRKTASGVCVQVNGDLQVCCYDDSKSCTVAATRWFTGKLDGLLGRADSSAQEIDQADWFLDTSCKNPNAKLRLPTQEAVRTCYDLFGRHRRAFFRDAINTVKPDAWRSVCESVLTANLRYKCAVMNAFVHHARLENVKVSAADECFSCKANKNEFPVGQTMPANAASLSTNFAKGTDLVFVLMPCKSEANQGNYQKLREIISEFSENPENRYSFIKVEENDASLVQSVDGAVHNSFNPKAFHVAETTQVSNEAFEKALIVAGSVFTQRLAQHRHLVFLSCGNCRPYRLNSLKYAYKLEKRNVVVSSIGDYEIKNLDSFESEERPVAYNSKTIYLFNDEKEEMDSDFLESYKIDHDVDMCAKLAIKTGGFVVAKDKKAMAETAALIWNAPSTSYSYKVGRCEKFATPYGDLTDFSYTRTELASEFEDY